MLSRGGKLRRTKRQEVSNLTRTNLLLLASNDLHKTIKYNVTKINSQNLKDFQNQFTNEIVKLDLQYYTGAGITDFSQSNSKSSIKQANKIAVTASVSKNITPFSPNSRKHGLSSKKIAYFNKNTIKSINKFNEKEKYEDGKNNLGFSRFKVNNKNEDLNTEKLLLKSEKTLKFELAHDCFSYLQFISCLKKRKDNTKQRQSRSQDKKDKKSIFQKKNMDPDSDSEGLLNKTPSCDKFKINYCKLEEIISMEAKKIEKNKVNKFKFIKLNIETENISKPGSPENNTPISAIEIELNFISNTPNHSSLSKSYSLMSNVSRTNSNDIDELRFSNPSSYNSSKYASKQSISFYLDKNSEKLNSRKNTETSYKKLEITHRRNSHFETPGSKFKIHLKNCRKSEMDLIMTTPTRSFNSTIFDNH